MLNPGVVGMAIRRHAVEVAKRVKRDGADNDLLDRILADKAFMLTREDLDRILDVRKFIGRAPEQTEEFLRDAAAPVLEANKDLLGVDVQIKV